MDEKKVSSQKAESSEKSKPRPMISRSRWTARSTQPRLVSISWSGVARRGAAR